LWSFRLCGTQRPVGSARVVVVGGSGTVGRAVVSALAVRGARVGFTFLHGEAVARELAERHTGVVARRVDVAAPDELARGLDALVTSLGGVDVLVHAAVVATGDGLAAVDEAMFDRIFRVNVKSAFFSAQHVVGHGAREIVLLGSIDGVRSVPSPVAYAASKGAVSALATSLAKELGPRAVRVNVVAPGILDAGASTVLSDEVKREYMKHCAMKRFGRPAEVAELVAWLALENTYVTGRTIVLDGGLG